jgi:bifunctional DNA-binding transcriptional regulator/antitoxin component of YhaV-PrlF toxin-antitoxin module
MRLTPVEAGRRIEIPAEWADELGLQKIAALERTVGGILIQPYPMPVSSWEEIFSKKLPVGPSAPTADLSEFSGDDLLF